MNNGDLQYGGQMRQQDSRLSDGLAASASFGHELGWIFLTFGRRSTIQTAQVSDTLHLIFLLRKSFFFANILTVHCASDSYKFHLRLGLTAGALLALGVHKELGLPVCLRSQDHLRG